MDHREVKLGNVQETQATCTTEGLRILARMIARQLVARKFGVDRQHTFSCSRPVIPEALTRQEAGNGGDKGTNR